MLLIALREDGGLTLTSDDRNAENQVVADCFEREEYDGESGDIWEEPQVDYAVIEAWDSAPFEEGKLEVEFAPEHTVPILEALERHFPAAGDVLAKVYEERQKNMPLKPKPKRV